ncbi:MAG: hypothetical protein DMF63_11180 [Acidobacteria bacterium]|nr:MAG: hypothetical protein DMF63_11180 [Acidobacteriota bacterium]
MPHIYFLRSIYVCFALALLIKVGVAQSQAIYFFDDKAAFLSATDQTRTIDFESVAPRKGFGKYAPNVGLNIDGINFRTSGGLKFGSGTIYVPSADYTSLNPGTKMLDGAHLSWGAPNEPGNAHLELKLPSGVNAVGADFWAMQPIVSPIEITVTTSDGLTHSTTVSTKKRPDSAFAGFISTSEITTVSITLAKAQSALLLDNLTFGRRADGIDLAAIAAKPSTASARMENETSPVVSPRTTSRETSGVKSESVAPTQNAQPAIVRESPDPSAAPGSGTAAAGTIAYVRGGTEIRSILPDGSNDRRLWTHADAHEGLGINELAWSPDGSELAFSSGHESVASFYHSDIFAMKANATGLRRVTNGPDRSDYSKYGKGTVTVTIRNEQPIFRTSKASAGIFFIYVVGADVPQAVVLPPGSSRILTFNNVADFGDHAQALVAVYGGNRWFIPGTDVKAGKVVKAPDFGISGDGIELFGAFRPIWKRDGSRISYRSGACIVSSISSRGTVGHTFDPVFTGEHPPAPCAYDWGPTAETADQLLYSVTKDEEIGIYRLKGSGAQHPGEKLVTISTEKFQFINDLRWLPDGSGFLYSASDLAYSFANILKYDMATRQIVPVTNFEETFVKSFSVSPDGKWIVFERTEKFIDNKADLWIVGIDGKGLRVLAKGASNPAWGK